MLRRGIDLTTVPRCGRLVSHKREGDMEIFDGFEVVTSRKTYRFKPPKARYFEIDGRLLRIQDEYSESLMIFNDWLSIRIVKVEAAV